MKNLFANTEEEEKYWQNIRGSIQLIFCVSPVDTFSTFFPDFLLPGIEILKKFIAREIADLTTMSRSI